MLSIASVLTADTGDRRRQLARARPASGAPRPARRTRPPTITSRHVGRRRRRTRPRRSGRPGARPGQADAVESHRDQVRECALADRPPSGPTEAARTRRGRGREQRGRPCGPRARRWRAARRARSPRASSNGSIDRVRVAADRQPRSPRRAAGARVRSRPRGRARSSGTGSRYAPALAEQRDVLLGDVGRVHRREPVAQGAPRNAAARSASRRRPRGRPRSPRGCSETCAWSGSARSAAHAATRAAASGWTARMLWIAAPSRVRGTVGPARPRARSRPRRRRRRNAAAPGRARSRRRGSTRRAASAARRPAAPASITARPIAFGSAYGVPSGPWCT